MNGFRASVLLVLLAIAFQLPAQQSVSQSKTNAPMPDVISFDEARIPNSTNSESALNDTNAAETNKTSPDSLFEETKADAEKGSDFDENLLGAMYEKGVGVAKDSTEAEKWYRKAAEQGNPNYQYEAGYYYERRKDYEEAAKWYQRAAEQGNLLAQMSLALFYQNGTGVPKNNVEAYKWYNLAAAHSVNNETDRKVIEVSASQRDSMVQAGEITSEQIAEAQRLSREFISHKESTSKFTPPQPDEIIADPTEPTASGTGFFITDDGYLITNNHVVKDATKVRLVTSAGTIDAKVVQVDAANDLALLKAVGKFSPLPIAASRSAHLGGTVVTIGFPDPTLQGYSPKLAKGEIASLSGAGDDPRYFQISVPVQPGNSGGALVDEHGNVIGIVSAKLDASVALAASGVLPENVNYAIKSSFLLSFLESTPDVSAKLKEPITVDRKFEDVVKSAQDAAVLVLVY
jgi:S1-C subfamily serine protease